MQTQTYSYTRSHLLETIQQVVAADEPVFIARKGHTEAVIMSAQQFEQIKVKQNGFAMRLMDWRHEYQSVLDVDDDFLPERQYKRLC